MPENEQINTQDRVDGLRREIEGKLSQLGLDRFMTKSDFRWLAGILATVALGILAYFIFQNGNTYNKVDELTQRVTRIETRLDEAAKINDKNR